MSNLFVGNKLVVEGAKKAAELCPGVSEVDLIFLSQEVYEGHEYYDGEPTTAEHQAKQIKKIYDFKQKKGVSIRTILG